MNTLALLLRCVRRQGRSFRWLGLRINPTKRHRYRNPYEAPPNRRRNRAAIRKTPVVQEYIWSIEILLLLMLLLQLHPPAEQQPKIHRRLPCSALLRILGAQGPLALLGINRFLSPSYWNRSRRRDAGRGSSHAQHRNSEQRRGKNAR